MFLFGSPSLRFFLYRRGISFFPCEIEVRSKWTWSEIKANTKWNRIDIEVKSKWNRSDIEVKPKWDRSEIKVGRWDEFELRLSWDWSEVEPKLSRAEIDLSWSRAAPELNWCWVGLRLLFSLRVCIRVAFVPLFISPDLKLASVPVLHTSNGQTWNEIKSHFFCVALQCSVGRWREGGTKEVSYMKVPIFKLWRMHAHELA